MKGKFFSPLFIAAAFFLFFLHCGFGHAAGNDTIYFPHAQSDGIWETEVCVVNTSDSRNLSGSFKSYDESGGMVSTIDGVVLSPKGRMEIILGRDFANAADIRYVVFEGDRGTVAGYMKLFVDGKYRVAIPGVLGSEINSRDIYIPHIALVENWRTFFSLVNTNSEPVSPTIKFNNGTTKQVDLAPGAYQYFSVLELFEDRLQPEILSAEIENASGVIGVELFIDSVADIGSGVLLKDDTTDRIYFPHIAASDGWGTGVVAYNPSDTAAQLTILSYDAKGTILNTSNDIINPNEKYIGTIKRLGLPTSTEWIEIQSTQRITGFELFTRTNVMGGYTGVNISRKDGIFPKLEKDGATGIAFVNLENEQASVTLTAYNNTGASVATRLLVLDGKNKEVAVAQKLFSGQDIGNATYIGYTSDREIVAFQLNRSADEMMLDGLPSLPVSEQPDLKQEVAEKLDLIFALMSERSWALDEVTAILRDGGPEVVVTPEKIDLKNPPKNISVEIDYGTGFVASDGAVISGGIVLEISNLVFSETQIGADFSLTFDNLERNGEEVANGSASGGFLLSPSGKTMQLAGNIRFDNLLIGDKTIDGMVSLAVSGITLNLSEVDSTGFESMTFTFDNLVLGKEKISSGTIAVTNPSATRIQLDADLSTGLGLIDMTMFVDRQDTDILVFSTDGASIIGDFTITMDSVTMNSTACPNYPVSGSIDFVRGDESGVVTFTDACDGSYLFNDNG